MIWLLGGAAQAENGIKVDLLVTKGDALITKTEVVTTDGVAVPVSQMTEMTYRAKATKAADDTVRITPGTVSTGFMYSNSRYAERWAHSPPRAWDGMT